MEPSYSLARLGSSLPGTGVSTRGTPGFGTWNASLRWVSILRDLHRLIPAIASPRSLSYDNVDRTGAPRATEIVEPLDVECGRAAHPGVPRRRGRDVCAGRGGDRSSHRALGTSVATARESPHV